MSFIISRIKPARVYCWVYDKTAYLLASSYLTADAEYSL